MAEEKVRGLAALISGSGLSRNRRAIFTEITQGAVVTQGASLGYPDFQLAPTSFSGWGLVLATGRLTGLRRFNRHPWHASVSTSCTVLSRNRDQFLRTMAVHHSGRMPTAVGARHDYHVGLDAMQP